MSSLVLITLFLFPRLLIIGANFIFSFIAIWQFLRWADTDKIKHLIFGIISFVFALLSKETIKNLQEIISYQNKAYKHLYKESFYDKIKENSLFLTLGILIGIAITL